MKALHKIDNTKSDSETKQMKENFETPPPPRMAMTVTKIYGTYVQSALEECLHKFLRGCWYLQIRIVSEGRTKTQENTNRHETKSYKFRIHFVNI